jgi:hypothetical protein
MTAATGHAQSAEMTIGRSSEQQTTHNHPKAGRRERDIACCGELHTDQNPGLRDAWRELRNGRLQAVRLHRARARKSPSFEPCDRLILCEWVDPGGFTGPVGCPHTPLCTPLCLGGPPKTCADRTPMLLDAVCVCRALSFCGPPCFVLDV